jgi:hypothetical protein
MGLPGSPQALHQTASCLSVVKFAKELPGIPPLVLPPSQIPVLQTGIPVFQFARLESIFPMFKTGIPVFPVFKD